MALTFQTPEKHWSALPPRIRQSIERMDSHKNTSGLTSYFRDMRAASPNVKRALTCVLLDLVSHELTQKGNDTYLNDLKEAFLEWFSIDASERIWIQRDSMLEKNHPGLRWINFYSCIQLLEERLKVEKIYDDWSPILHNLWKRLHIEIEKNATRGTLSILDMWNEISFVSTRSNLDALMFLGQYNDEETPTELSKKYNDALIHMIMYSCSTMGLQDVVKVAAGIYGEKVSLDEVADIVKQHLLNRQNNIKEIDSSELDLDFEI